MADDTQTTLVLIPGLLCDAVVWQHAVDRFEPEMRVSVADLSSQDSITDMARDTLAANPGPLCVVGHSMGARVALEMYRLAPERIEKLALLDTGVHPRVESEVARRKYRVDLAYSQGMSALAADWLPPMVHPDRHGDAGLMGALTAMVERMTPELHERQIRALLNRPDASTMLAEITVPTLVLVGREDAWSPVDQHAEMAEILPDAQLVVIEDAGHFAPIERPEAVTAALERWLAG
ncbi:MAG: alpha/beta hydrolase [Hyphomicrobiales bacterium]|nr:alpha/beta hydrolase [Hyphomicrobiales bacterium]